MKAGRKPQDLTEKEKIIMQMLWANGPLFVREMVEKYPEPKPHFNTVSTLVRILEDKGHVTHEVVGSSHRYIAVTRKEEVIKRSFAEMVKDYFNNSYKTAVSTLVEDEKISIEDLREIIDLIESKEKERAHK